MKKKLYLILTLLVILSTTNSCQKDDICPEATPTTPLLIIRFYDFNDPDDLKPVPRLNLIAEGKTDSLFVNEQTTDSIAIPLKTFQNSTEYQLIINVGEESEEEIPANSDVVNFTYAVNEVYVSKACGFKTEYLDLQAARETETPATDNWIKNIQVEQTLINNEIRAHLYIYH